MVQGIPNEGATCWFGSLIQCLRISREWNEDPGDDPFVQEFYKIMKSEPNQFLQEFVKQFPDFIDLPSDSQEALFFILDRLGDARTKDFTGEVTQKTHWPGGESIIKYPCTIWWNPKKDLVLSDYKDDSGNVFHVAIQETILSTQPKILVTSCSEPPNEKGLFALVALYGGHYVSFVKPNDEWLLVNDNVVHKASPNLSQSYYLSFHTTVKGFEP